MRKTNKEKRKKKESISYTYVCSKKYLKNKHILKN